jgi:hypothetical protein
MRTVPFPVDPAGPARRPEHASIDAARDASGADGTRSILDMDRVSTKPRGPNKLEEMMQVALANARGGVVDLSDMVPSMYGTAKPTREGVETSPDFLDTVDRGTGVYMILYEGDLPSEICFAGYSYD